MSPIDLMTDPSIAVVSFDVFDTLIQRATAAPTDVFACLEPLVEETTRGAFPNFQQVRPILARLAKEKRGQPRQECTLAEMYSLLTEWQLLGPDQAEALIAAEIKAEKAVMMRREEGCRLFEAAKSAGKRVILISDMYLTAEAIKDILTSLGLSGYAALYLSSELRGQKYFGDFWDIMLAEEGIDPAGVIHIGDHPISDYENPQARGIRAFVRPKAVQAFKAHPLNQRLYGQGFPDSAFPDASLFPSIAMGLECARFTPTPPGP